MPEHTASEQFFDAMVRHQIGLLRVVGSTRNDIVSLLDATESDIRRQIEESARIGIGVERPAQVQRLDRLLATLTAIRSDAWREVGRTVLDVLEDVARQEPRFVDRILRTTMPVDLDTKLPNARRLVSIVRSNPFQGRIAREWLRNIRRRDLERMESQIKIGLTQGEGGRQIARRVVGTVSARGANGVTEITRRQAAGIVRTSVNAIANFSRQEYHAANSHLFQKELYVATLDSRTTIECASLDGQRFPINEGPRPPVHFNCRSLRVALVDPEPIGERPMNPTTRRQLLREFSEKQGISTVRRREDLPFGTKGKFDEFARRRVREMIGRTPSKVTFNQFLERQPKAFQNDYLGDTRAKLFREGVPLNRFIDPTGRPIPLSRLAEMEASAFRAAGLDPGEF